MFPTKIISATKENSFLIELEIKKENVVKNIATSEFFINQENLLFSCENYIQRFYFEQDLDTKDIKNLEIKFTTNSHKLQFELPCFSICTENEMWEKIQEKENDADDSSNFKENVNLDLLSMKNITKACILIVDGRNIDFKKSFSYGFNGNYCDDTTLLEENLKSICRVSNPSIMGPIERIIQRESDEQKDFCRDQYKLNFVELQVPEGFENPMKFTFNYDDSCISKNEEVLINRIHSEKLNESSLLTSEIECGLVSILLAICYDIRTTANEITCESSWTRITLSSTLCYFERTTSLKSVVISFLRRSLIYPLYRNYELSQTCVMDVAKALKQNPKWILKQLLCNYNLFHNKHIDENQCLNKFYVKNYVQYCAEKSSEDFAVLAKNLKNVISCIKKKDLGLNLTDIETELLKELIDDIHLASSDSDDDESSSEFEGDDDDEDNAENDSNDSDKTIE